MMLCEQGAALLAQNQGSEDQEEPAFLCMCIVFMNKSIHHSLNCCSIWTGGRGREGGGERGRGVYNRQQLECHGQASTTSLSRGAGVDPSLQGRDYGTAVL